MQFIPTATTCEQASAIEEQSSKESPLTTLTPSFELKENQAGIFTSPSSRISAYACVKPNKKKTKKHHLLLKYFSFGVS